jgi:hypothetical protein
VTAVGAEVVQGPGHDFFGTDVDRGDADRAGLQAAHVEQIGHEAVEAVEGLVVRGEQFGAVVFIEVDVGAAQAGNGGFGGGERCAQVVADGGEQRGAHPVGLGERLGRRSFGGEAFLAKCDGGLRGEGLHDAPVGRLQ